MKEEKNVKNNSGPLSDEDLARVTGGVAFIPGEGERYSVVCASVHDEKANRCPKGSYCASMDCIMVFRCQYALRMG